MLNKVFKCQYGPAKAFLVSSPLGRLQLVSCPNGIHSLELPTTLTDDKFTPDLSVKVSVEEQPGQEPSGLYKPVQECVSWLNTYFQKDKEAIQATVLPSICMFKGQNQEEGTFTSRVWRTLAEEVSFGQTVSYGQLAGMCGNASASRAVGQAMRNNPVVLIVPCHRVLLSGGTVGNYSGGRMNWVKAWLLKYEGAENVNM